MIFLTKILAKISFVIDYDYYPYSDYRGGYTEPFYDDYYRSYDGDYYFDLHPSGVAPATTMVGNGPQRYTSRSNSVGFGLIQILQKLIEKIVIVIELKLIIHCDSCSLHFVVNFKRVIL